VQNFSLKKIKDIMQEFQDTTEISGHSGQILKFQEFQDNAQACTVNSSRSQLVTMPLYTTVN